MAKLDSGPVHRGRLFGGASSRRLRAAERVRATRHDTAGGRRKLGKDINLEKAVGLRVTPCF